MKNETTIQNSQRSADFSPLHLPTTRSAHLSSLRLPPAGSAVKRNKFRDPFQMGRSLRFLLYVSLSLWLTPSYAQVPPTNQIAPSTLAVMTDSNSVLKQPTNFFTVNSNLLNAAVSPGGTNSPVLNGVNPFSNTNVFAGTVAFSNQFTTFTNSVNGYHVDITSNASINAAGLDFHFGASQTNAGNTNSFGAGYGQTMGTNTNTVLIGSTSIATNDNSVAVVGVGLTANNITNEVVVGVPAAKAEFTNNKVNFIGTLNGNGSGLTTLNGSQVTSGTIPLAQLPAAVITNNNAATVTLQSNLALANGELSAFTVTNIATPRGYSGHSLVVSNGVDNVLTLQNMDPKHFSAIVMVDPSNQWHTAFGWGNPNTTNGSPYPQMNYWEALFQDPLGIVSGGELEFGLQGREGTRGDFVRWKTGSTNATNATVVFRVSGLGTTSIASNLNVGGVTSFSNTVSSTSYITAQRLVTSQGNVQASTQVALDMGQNDSGVNYETTSPGGIVCLTSAVVGGYTHAETAANQGWWPYPAFCVGPNLHDGTKWGTAMFQVQGSTATDVKSKATSYTTDAGDSTILITATAQTVTLPDATSHCAGRIYTVKLTASGSGTVATTSSQHIDGATTFSLSAQYKYVTVQSDGTQWWIIANN